MDWEASAGYSLFPRKRESRDAGSYGEGATVGVSGEMDLGTLVVTDKQREERMRWLILGAALSAVAAPALAAEFMLASTEVKSGSPMGQAQVFTACKGQNISPALSWSGEPTGTQSFAVTIYDADARAGGGWWHWTVFNIPPTVHSLAAGAGTEGSRDLPAGASQGRNDFGLSQYSGPCPPVGDHAHHYEITVYAVKVAQLPFGNTASGAAVSSQLGSNTLATAKIVGRYERPN
jgi:Raf kinase inhibitor-like YbhB/YbcL family protein